MLFLRLSGTIGDECSTIIDQLPAPKLTVVKPGFPSPNTSNGPIRPSSSEDHASLERKQLLKEQFGQVLSELNILRCPYLLEMTAIVGPQNAQLPGTIINGVEKLRPAFKKEFCDCASEAVKVSLTFTHMIEALNSVQ